MRKLAWCINMNYGEKLKDLRERIGLTLVETSKIINVSDSLYSRYEKEKQTIPIKHLVTLCNYFDVSLDYIFNFTNTRQYKNLNKEINNELIGQRLKEFRKNNNLTQEKIASFLKIDQPTWSIYEHGKSIIGTPFLYMISSKYHISIDYLLGRIN